MEALSELNPLNSTFASVTVKSDMYNCMGVLKFSSPLWAYKL